MGRTKETSNYHKTYVNRKDLDKWKHHLSECTISRGCHYTKQNDSWDCGPNSSARALDMWMKNDIDFRDYGHFKSYCPKLYNSIMDTCTGFWDRIFVAVGFGIANSINNNCTDVGPTPKALAKYITKCLGGKGRGIYSGNYFFDSTLNEIKADLDANDPVIALLSFSPTSMHYVNVVAVSDNDDVAILDTNNSLYYYSKNDFEDLMDCCSYIPHNIFLNNYNLIRFEPSPGDHLVTRIIKISGEMAYWGE